MFYQKMIRPILFRLNPEIAHHMVLELLKFSQKFPLLLSLWRHFFCPKNKNLECTHFGITFPNLLGMAAGFDKNAEVMHAIEAIGFGFMEIGTITPKPQIGNSRPRLWRLAAEQGIINRMGLNNQGVDAIVERLKHRPQKLIIAANIGKNTATPVEHWIADFATCFEKLHPYVDYFVLNLSCPNVGTQNHFKDPIFLQQLIEKLEKINRNLGRKRPILLKISPDLNCNEFDTVIKIVKQNQLAGIVATNTTTDYQSLYQPITHQGGLSGRPLFEKSTAVLRYLNAQKQNDLTLVGVGGITNAETAQTKIQAGANLIEIYSGLIYYGFGIVKAILEKQD